MKIVPGQNQATPVEPPSPSANPAKTERTAQQSLAVATDGKDTGAGNNTAVPTLERPTDVTYKQDSNGRVYYSVSDAKSGQEILEVPPKALRDVSQGIEDYLKQEESKASAHVKVKA
jgi:uncharacterized FlaG/YvyC family protein